MWDVVIIGAGLAGLTCARHLHQTGHKVLVLEKSRGLGGRLATRRINTIPVDHGCRFLQPTTPQLSTLIAHLQQQGDLVPWQPQTFQLQAKTAIAPYPLEQPLFIAPAGMTAVAKHLAAGLTIQRQSRVVALEAARCTWQVRLDANARDAIRAKAVVLAVPAPQAINLLPNHTVTQQQWQPYLQSVEYGACLSIMVGFDEESPVGPVQTDQGWMVWGQSDSPIAWAGLDSGKPGRAGQTVVIQSSEAFAARYLDTTDLTAAAQQLITAATPILKPASQPRWWQSHRWRYSQVIQPGALAHSPSDSQWIPTDGDLPLWCCGDWCRGKDTAAALASGQETGQQVHQYLASAA